MNLNGIANSPMVIRPGTAEPRQRVEQEQAGQASGAEAVRSQSAAQAVRVELRSPEQALPVEPPAGTDPELWAVLSTEERAYFAKVGAMGPLTYGHLMSHGQPAAEHTAPASRGVRLDVRA